MIDRQHGKILIECDSCHEVFDADTGEFPDAWSAAKDEGWRAHKVGDQWMHGCPRCVDKKLTCWSGK